MKILIVTFNGLWDACFPLIESLKDKCDLYCALELIPEQSNLLDITPNDFCKDNIIEGGYVKGLEKYKTIVPIEKTFVLRKHTPKHIFHFFFDSILENRFIKRLNPDFVYFFHDPVYSLSFIRNTSIPWGVAVHDPIPHDGGRTIINFLRKVIFKRCNNFFLFSQNLIPLFREYYNLENVNIYSTKLGVYSQLSSLYGMSTREERAKDGTLKLLFFGKIAPYKGLPILLNAYKCLRKKGLSVELTIAGKGFVDGNIFPLTKENGIHLYNDYIDEPKLVGLIKDCDLVVCPYVEATQSGVIMTAFAFCTPVVATNVGGLTEMVRDNVSGRIIEPSSERALVEVINDIYSNREVLNHWRKNIFNEFYKGEQGRESITGNLLRNIETIVENDKQNS